MAFVQCIWMTIFIFFAREFVVFGLPENVKICGLFESENDRLEYAFRYAIERVNSNKDVLKRSKLTPVVDNLVLDDSFHVAKKVCSVFRLGVAAVFGPQSGVSSPAVQSLAEAFEVPHVETRWDYRAHRPRFSLNLHPHPASLSKAYFDLINAWRWKSFTVIYEDNQGLVRLQELLKANYDIRVRKFIRQMDPGDDYRSLLKELKKATEFRIILDCSKDRIQPILKQAQDMGMMNDYYHYFFTSLDFHTVDLDEFRNTEANITGIRLVKEEVAASGAFQRDFRFELGYHSRTNARSGPLTTEAALMHDAVKVFAKALHDIDSSKSVDIQPMSCNQSGSTWMYGNSIIQRMKQLRMDGLTGRIMFDENGFRKNFNLDIISLEKDSFYKNGVWNTLSGLNFTMTAPSKAGGESQTPAPSMANKHYRITTKLSEPYVMEKADVEKYSGNDRYEGYSLDLIKEIAAFLQFNYTISVTPDGQYGNWLKELGEFKNGMFKELVDHQADIGIGDLAITYDRETGVDFTMPFMNLGISILFKKPSKKDPNLFSFLSPLSIDVWLYMATAYLGVSIILFLLARVSPFEWISPHPCDPELEELENQFSLSNCMWFTIGSLMQQGCDFLPKFNPYDWENPHPCDPDPDELENKFGLCNSMWFTIGSLMQQGSDLAPKAVSTRLVAGIWWFFTLIMISSYTANLAAFLTVQRMDSPITSVNDLAAQNKIKYGCQGGGATNAFFKDSSMSVYQNMYMSMESAQPSVYAKTSKEGVDRVKKGDYAYLMESTANEFYRERDCDLVQIGGLLDSKSYGIALPPGSNHLSLLNNAILNLQEKGELLNLKKKWWQTKGGGKCLNEPAATSSASELGLTNVGGVFVVLLGGMAMACVVGIMEFVWKTRKTVREERGDFWEEVKREIRFAMKCGSSKKPIVRKVDTKDQMSLPLTNYS